MLEGTKKISRGLFIPLAKLYYYCYNNYEIDIYEMHFIYNFFYLLLLYEFDSYVYAVYL